MKRRSQKESERRSLGLDGPPNFRLKSDCQPRRVNAGRRIMFTRQSYQLGSLRKLKRRKGPPVWEFRYRDKQIAGHPQRQMTLSAVTFPTATSARHHVEALLFRLNSGAREAEGRELTFGALLDLFIEDEHLKEVSALKPGGANVWSTLKVSTARGYLQLIEKRIRPRWGNSLVSAVRPAGVDEWLRKMDLQPVTKSHIKALMSRLFNKAMLWELISFPA